MTDLIDLQARRWEKVDDPAKHHAIDALHAAIRAIENGDTPEHIFVIFGNTNEEGAGVQRFFQAGSYSLHTQLGLLEATKFRLWESD